MKNRHVPDLYIEKLALGEMDPDRERELLPDPDVQRRVEELRRSDSEILEQYPPGEVAELILRRAEDEPREEPPSNVVQFPGADRAAKRVRPFLLIAAAAALVAAVLLPLTLSRDGAGTVGQVALSDGTRIKGLAPVMHVYRKSTAGVTELKRNAGVTEGDLLQISYNAAGRAFGAIVSIDGRGVVTLHYPAYENAAPILERNGEVALDYSYRLDDAPGFERFFFVTSDREFSVAAVLDAARRLAATPSRGSSGSLSLPRGVDQYDVLLKKEAVR